MAGEWLTAAANTNMFTYEIAPVFILMENECLKKMREIIGFQTGDSILAPGEERGFAATFFRFTRVSAAVFLGTMLRLNPIAPYSIGLLYD